MTPDITQLQIFRKDMLLGKPASPEHLQMLSLAAALSKFERLPTPKTTAASLPVLRLANYPSASTRRTMIRLLSGRDSNVSDSMAAAIPQILQQHGLSLHPFDFARLEDFVTRHLERLSPDAREWLRLIRPERKEADDPYLDGPISEEHLMQASKAQRIQYLRELRARDAARARELIAGMMPSETAEMRLRLLKIIDDTPAADDQPFLETLVKDRAPTVKDLAQRLLSRIPGTETFVRQAARLRDALQIKTEGLLRRRKVFVFKGPDPKPGQDRFADLLGGMSLNDAAAALGEEPASLVAIAMNSEKLLDLQLRLIRLAVDHGSIPLITKAAEQVNDPDGMLMNALIDEAFAERPESDRAAILRLCFTPAAWKQLPQLHIISQIAPRIPPALPERTARDLINHPDWGKMEEGTKKLYFDAIAHLIPQQLSVEFARMAESVAPRAALYHRFISSLT